MDAARILRSARHKAGLTLRDLGDRAGTSHSTLAAYESGTKTPNVATLDRVLRAAGFAADVQLHRRHTTGPSVPASHTAPSAPAMSRGDELIAVLELATAFPAHHTDTLSAPIFGRVDS